MNGPQRFAEYLNGQLYHPRSDAHSNKLCLLLLDDLLDNCPALARKATTGEVVAKTNLTQIVGNNRWNVDLVVGPPPGKPVPPDSGQRVRIAKPAVIQIALEAKGVMTEHGKARYNRLRDFQAFHDYAHKYDQYAIAAGIIIINMSKYYWSPTRKESDITEHKNLANLIKETVEIYRTLPLRRDSADGPGLEAFCVVVVKHDNLKKNPNLPSGFRPAKTELITGSPAPPVGDPLNYSAALHRICEAYTRRFP